MNDSPLPYSYCMLLFLMDFLHWSSKEFLSLVSPLSLTCDVIGLKPINAMFPPKLRFLTSSIPGTFMIAIGDGPLYVMRRKTSQDNKTFGITINCPFSARQKQGV
jgi:hypothetical protein